VVVCGTVENGSKYHSEHNLSGFQTLAYSIGRFTWSIYIDCLQAYIDCL